MPAIRSGELRHRVELQAPENNQNPVTGEVTTTWVTIARPWAKITPMSAREFLAANAEQSEMRGRIAIRYRAEVNAAMRILHRGMIYNILGLMPDAESGIEHQTLMVGEGVRYQP